MSALVVSVFLLSGCIRQLPETDGHMALANLVKRGYARDKEYIRNQEGSEIRIWGYVDHANISLSEGTIENKPLDWTILKNDGGSYFDLKARLNDDAGESIRIRIIGSEEQYKEVFKKLRDMRTVNPQTPALVTGIMRTFEAPTNTGLLIGVSIDLESPENIKFN